MKIMNFNINFKQGMRRIILAFIGFCMIFALCCFVGAGCIFDSYKYVDNVKLTSVKTNKTVTLSDFLNWDNNANYISRWDIKCYPYKQYCEYQDWQYRRNKAIELSKQDKKIVLTISAPSPLQYFFWQLWDFIKIFLYAFLAFSIYLLLELVFCWIIKGFKE